MDESQLGPLPETEPSATDRNVPSGIDSSTALPEFTPSASGKDDVGENVVQGSDPDGRGGKTTTPPLLVRTNDTAFCTIHCHYVGHGIFSHI